MLKCAWRLEPGSLTVRWEERWPCPSCIHRRWYYTDTVALTQKWIHKSLIWTSSTGAQLWLGDSHHCPTNQTGKTSFESKILIQFFSETIKILHQIIIYNINYAILKNILHQILLSFAGWSQSSACYETFPHWPHLVNTDKWVGTY